jgi:hypothetical protein
VRVVFDFNASESDSAPFESILLSVEWCVSVGEYIKRYIEWYIVIWHWFIYSHPRSSWMRVVFDFNASASDSAPFESILLSGEWCVSVCEYIKKYIEWYIVTLYWFIYLHSRLSWVRVVFDFNASASDLAFFESIWLPVRWCVSVGEYIKRYVEWYIVIWHWFIYSHPRSSWMRVVFDFNASAKVSAPFESIWFPVEWCVSVGEYIKRYIEWYIVILYWFIYLHSRLSWVRVVFDFNASASDSAPFELILLSGEWCASVYVNI